MDQAAQAMANANIAGDQPARQRHGLRPLAPKIGKNPSGQTVELISNMAKLSTAANTPIYKYDVNIVVVYKNQDGAEVSIEKSKSTKSGTAHDVDKTLCRTIFDMAMKKLAGFNGQNSFYDLQASMYTLKKIPMEKNPQKPTIFDPKTQNFQSDFSVTLTTGVSTAPNFIRAVFTLKAVATTYQASTNDLRRTATSAPALADKSILEALSLFISGPALANPKVITVGNCVHYYDGTMRGFTPRDYPEGGTFSALGVSKGVKMVEGGVMMNTEMKVTLFHPDNEPLINVMKTLKGFSPNLGLSSQEGINAAKALKGLEFFCNYGDLKDKGNERRIVKALDFGGSARSTTFLVDNEPTSVEAYFQNKYKERLAFPNLMTVIVKGRNGSRVNIPAELLDFCPNQKVTNERMTVKNQQAELIKDAAAAPEKRMQYTQTAANAVGIHSKNVMNFIKVEEPTTLKGIVLNKPTIKFSTPNPVAFDARVPTDFKINGKFVMPAKMDNWEVVFMRNEEVRDFTKRISQAMGQCGMAVQPPVVSFINSGGDLPNLFEKARSSKRQLLMFVFRRSVPLHAQIKSLEQKFDILTQEITLETAEKIFRQPQTLQNIVNKTNMKLGGLNYRIDSTVLNPNILFIGFETSSKGGAGDVGIINLKFGPVSIGFAANMMQNHQQFAGGYIYAPQARDVGKNQYFQIFQQKVNIFRPMDLWSAQCSNKFSESSDATARIHHKRSSCTSMESPRDSMDSNHERIRNLNLQINEVYSEEIKKTIMAIKADWRPRLMIIATSKAHNERFYQLEKNKAVSNLAPGTVIDHTVVSPVFSEFYLASAVARQGTAKATKYTIIFATNPEANLARIETITNDLCFDHQIVFQPVSLPVPLFIAGRCSQRGAAVLGYNG
ncbi:Protein CBG06401 [Caenorhabditis briggsae]|uniref:Protein CBG06401 n=1 Tax=Caenorhabditis briggsae TaxID=6238 RepID=A8X254_CAEBR|nr:Protein CBG06401 [Caenorhabditis briggsae]CAP26714.2 Protein CBG06401 [Caenorhabditis briggsae]